MKYILTLLGLATLLSTTGCIIREHRGGYYGHLEYEHGSYRHYPNWWDRDWDDREHWHRY